MKVYFVQAASEHPDGLGCHTPPPNWGAAAHEGWPHPGDWGSKVKKIFFIYSAEGIQDKIIINYNLLRDWKYINVITLT